jgi:uncharacterized protein (TIGR00299 family) protein
MSDSRFAILDPAAGISGDMLLGALVAAGAPADWLAGLPERLGLPGVRIEIESVDRCGVRATKVNVRLPGGELESPAETHQLEAPHRHRRAKGRHSHGKGHGPDRRDGKGHGPHRHIGELIEILRRAPLSEWVRGRAIRAFELLGEAEGRVHGVPAAAVPLHEVGALDALVDVVGGIEGFERLGVREVYNRPVALGSGWIRAAHGAMPVPAPATGALVEGLEIASSGPVMGEATTPTGAALLRVLSAGVPPARWRVVSAGNWGAGGRNPDEYPNALRLILAEPAREAGEVVLLSTDLDDLSPEYLAPLRDALTTAGALDVQVWTTQMKKGRTGFRVEATVAPADADRVTEAFFRHSTTAGVRRHSAERVTLPRREFRLDAEGGTVRVKVWEGPDGLRAKPEYDDVAEAARRSGRPAHELARDLQNRALELAAADPPGRGATERKEPQ